MIKNIYLGFNIFGKKEFFKVFFAYLLFGIYSFFTYDIIFKIINTLDFAGLSSINYTQYIINTLGWNLLLLILMIFGLILFLVNLTTTISNTENKNKQGFFEKLVNSFKFSLVSLVVGITLLIIFLVLGINLNIFTIIVSIIFVLLSVFLALLFYIGNIYLGLENITVKKSLEKARLFIIKKFWTTVAFLMLLFFANYIIYYILDFLYFQIFFYNVIAGIITIEIIYIVTILYSLNALLLYIKSQKIK